MIAQNYNESQGRPRIMPVPVTPVSPSLYSYMIAMGVREPEVLRALREETSRLPNASWATTPEQMAFLQILVRISGARRILELGTFTGYSTLALALALPKDGEVVTCDIASGWSEMGTHYWRDAGVEKLIDRRVGRGTDVCNALLDEGRAGSFDMVFIDADKANYPDYLALAERLLRPGSLLVADNVFWGGSVVDAQCDDAEAVGIRRFNEALAGNDRFEIAMIPVSDGMTLALKK